MHWTDRLAIAASAPYHKAASKTTKNALKSKTLIILIKY